MSGNDNRKFRLLSRIVREEANAIANSHGIASIAFGDRSPPSFFGGPCRPAPAEQVDAEDVHENLVRARRAFLTLSEDRAAVALPSRASWSAPAALLALERRADELSEVRDRDAALMRLVHRWTRDTTEPLWGCVDVVPLMQAHADFYGAIAAFEPTPPRAVPAPISGSVRRDVSRGIARTYLRDLRDAARGNALATALLSAIEAHPGSSASKLERAVRVKHGALSKLFPQLLTDGRIVNRGTAARPRYYLGANVHSANSPHSRSPS